MESEYRALPWDDPAIDLLDLATRSRVATYWEGRASAELEVARAFTELSSDLAGTGARSEVIDLLARSIENEHEHASLCWRLACRYADADVAEPVMPERTEYPRMPSVPEELRPTLHALGLCCVNESIATVWLERCLSFASSPLVRGATRLHLRDEVVHARAGWAHLGSPSISAAQKKEIEKWIGPLLRANVGAWLDAKTLAATAGVPEHGMPPEEGHREFVMEVVRGVIIPGLVHVGLRLPDTES